VGYGGQPPPHLCSPSGSLPLPLRRQPCRFLSPCCLCRAARYSPLPGHHWLLDACNLSCDALSNALHSLIKLSSLLSLSRIGTQRSTHGSMNTSYISSLLSYGTVTICPLDLNRICKYILRLNMPVLLMQQILPCIAISATCSCHVASQPHVAAMLPVDQYIYGWQVQTTALLVAAGLLSSAQQPVAAGRHLSFLLRGSRGPSQLTPPGPALLTPSGAGWRCQWTLAWLLWALCLMMPMLLLHLPLVSVEICYSGLLCSGGALHGSVSKFTDI